MKNSKATPIRKKPIKVTSPITKASMDIKKEFKNALSDEDSYVDSTYDEYTEAEDMMLVSRNCGLNY